MAEMVCATCGHVGKVKSEGRGSIVMLLVLFLLMLIPGVIYLVYMLTGSQQVCASCGSREVIGLDSPRGRELVARYASRG